MTRDLVFQKRLNDLLLKQLRQLKRTTDKLNNEICKALPLLLNTSLCRTTRYAVRQGVAKVDMWAIVAK